MFWIYDVLEIYTVCTNRFSQLIHLFCITVWLSKKIYLFCIMAYHKLHHNMYQLMRFMLVALLNFVPYPKNYAVWHGRKLVVFGYDLIQVHFSHILQGYFTGAGATPLFITKEKDLFLYYKQKYLHCIEQITCFTSAIEANANDTGTLKTKGCQFDNFVIIGGTVSCRNDNLPCHQWWQNCPIDDLLFSM